MVARSSAAFLLDVLLRKGVLVFAPRAETQDVRQWRVYWNGKPWMCAGLERVWRAVQEEMPRIGAQALELTLKDLHAEQEQIGSPLTSRWPRSAPGRHRPMAKSEPFQVRSSNILGCIISLRRRGSGRAFGSKF